MTYQQTAFCVALAVIAVMSAATFFAFVIDKRRAVKGQERTKEKTLLGMTACFGALGALIGRAVVHHKSNKVYFGIVIWWSLILHAALVVYLAYLAFLVYGGISYGRTKAHE